MNPFSFAMVTSPNRIIQTVVNYRGLHLTLKSSIYERKGERKPKGGVEKGAPTQGKRFEGI
jgi:hypothetical protein